QPQTITTSATRSYDIRAVANQALPGGFHARGRINYFSSIITNQTFNTNILDATRNTRTYGGNVVGNWGGYSLNGTFDRTEYFYDANSSGVNGGAPRFSFSRSERPLFGSDLYFALGGEAVHLLHEDKGLATVVDKTLSRFDVNPQIRFPFKKWQWFTVNSSLAWRDTFYTRSLDPNHND